MSVKLADWLMTALGKKAKSQANILLTRENKSQKNYYTQHSYFFNMKKNKYTCYYDLDTVNVIFEQWQHLFFQVTSINLNYICMFTECIFL